jgi:hypothetical protein
VIDFRLIHDGQHWVADHPTVSARGQTMAELDRNLARAMRALPDQFTGNQVDVRMTFDQAVIPQWMRQYANHYFNRIVKIDIGDGQERS